MRDITLGITFYDFFTTRAFATGIPTTLAGSPVIDIYEENNTTEITGAETLSVDFDGVGGLNQLAIVATGGNGFENGKTYAAVITTGTVGGVSVVGEVVFKFTVGQSAAAVDAANATDGFGALKTLIDAIPTTAMRGTDSASTHSANDVRDAIIDDATRFSGANIDAAVTTRAPSGEYDTEMARITAARAQVLDDWINGGRLDLILDAILAMLDDPRAEPGQGDPAVNPDAMTKLDYLYKSWRNKKDNTGALNRIYADDGTTVDHKATTTEAAGVTTIGEMGTGA